MDLYSETFVLQSSPGFANKKKWRSVQLLTSESELEKVADVARRENFWAKKVKKFWGEIFPIDFFSFLDKRNEVLR